MPILYSDPATGALVRQMTDHPSINHATYFLQSSFTPDNRTLIFTSYRTGCAQLFEIAFPGGRDRANSPAGARDPSVLARHPSRRPHHLFRARRRDLGYRPGDAAPSAASSGSRARSWASVRSAAAASGSRPPSSRASSAGIVAGRADGSGWHLIPFPRTVIHPQFHPLEPEWIEFAGDPAPRMHRVRRDGSRPGVPLPAR